MVTKFSSFRYFLFKLKTFVIFINDMLRVDSLLNQVTRRIFFHLVGVRDIGLQWV